MILASLLFEAQPNDDREECSNELLAAKQHVKEAGARDEVLENVAKGYFFERFSGTFLGISSGVSLSWMGKLIGKVGQNRCMAVAFPR